MMTTDTFPIRADVSWRNIDGIALVVQPKEGAIYPLNSVATKIWLLSDGTRCVADIIEALVSEFEGEPDEIRKDTLLFLEELERASLIKSGQREGTVSHTKG